MSSFLAVPTVTTVRVPIIIRVGGLPAAVQLLVRPNQAPDLGLTAQKYIWKSSKLIYPHLVAQVCGAGAGGAAAARLGSGGRDLRLEAGVLRGVT